jgi:hypothetical protein
MNLPRSLAHINLGHVRPLTGHIVRKTTQTLPLRDSFSLARNLLLRKPLPPDDASFGFAVDHV